MKILVIDDEEEILKFLGNYLKSIGYEVETANGGETGWEKFIQSPDSFSLIISDVRMPDLGGIELLQRLSDHEHKIPFIFMTGHLEEEASLKQQNLDFSTVLLKPFSLEKLEKEIDQSQ